MSNTAAAILSEYESLHDGHDEVREAYVDYLFDIATEAPDRPLQPPDAPHIDAPATFLMDFLQTLASTVPPPPITRHGMDAALDILFAHPALRPLLLDDHTSVALQEHFEISYLSPERPVLAAHWTHIIRPAWDQHRELQRVIATSAQAQRSQG
jgi:hypothetical protein